MSIWWRGKAEDKSAFRAPKELCTLSFYIWNMRSHHIHWSVLKIPGLGNFSFPVADEVISLVRLCVLPRAKASRSASLSR